MRPPKNIDVPFDLLFPLLVYYFAQLREKEKTGGEWSMDVTWDKVCEAVDVSRAVSLSYKQLDSLLYSYKAGVVDKRRPFKIMTFHAKHYLPIMQKFKHQFPDLFKEEIDGDINLIGNGYE